MKPVNRCYLMGVTLLMLACGDVGGPDGLGGAGGDVRGPEGLGGAGGDIGGPEGLGGAGGDGAVSRGPSLEEINAMFPFAPNTPMNVYFRCQIANSVLDYQLHLREDQTFVIGAELDTGDTAFASGVYSYQNDVISLQTNPNNFIHLDEQTTSINPALGIVHSFATQVMVCVAIGHEEDDAASRVSASYECPEFSEGPASSQVNFYEFDVFLPGSIFRHRNRWIRFNDQPIIQRGYGIYRHAGNEHYGYFGNQFDDYNVVTGTFSNGNNTVLVDQLPNGSSECARRQGF